LVFPGYGNYHSRLVEKNIKADIIKYETNIVINSKLHPKMLYKYLKDKNNVRDTIGAINDSDGCIVTDTKDICDIFNACIFLK
jgi:hypothetical protein